MYHLNCVLKFIQLNTFYININIINMQFTVLCLIKVFFFLLLLPYFSLTFSSNLDRNNMTTTLPFCPHVEHHPHVIFCHS